MKRYRFPALALTLALLFSGCSAPVSTETVPPETPSVQISAEPPAAQDYSVEDTISFLTSEACGGRAVGSEGNMAAAQYIADAFSRFGLSPYFGDSYFMEYGDETAEPSSVPSVTLLAHDGTEIPLVPGRDYISTPACSDIFYEGPLIRDAHAAAKGEGLLLAENLHAAVAYTEEDVHRIAMYLEFGSVGSPFTGIDHQSGMRIRLLNGKAYAKVREAECIRIEAKQSADPKGTAYNVAGYFPGIKGENAFVIMAHFDGSGMFGELLFPSAYDNASGTAALLHAAALYGKSTHTSEHDIIFLGTNGEESGLGGASAFCKQLEERYAQVNCINIDCIGKAGRDFIDVYTDSRTAAENPLAEALVSLGTAENARIRTETYMGDNRAVGGGFLTVTLADCGESNEDALHTPNDTADTLNMFRIGSAAKLVADFLSSHTGPLYEKQPAPQVQDTLLSEKRLSVIRDMQLAQDQFVYIREGTEHLLFFGETADTAEALGRIFPRLPLPLRAGEYTLAFVTPESEWLKSGTVRLIAVGKSLLLEGITIPSSAFESGKVYPLSYLIEMGALRVSFTAHYSGEGKTASLHVMLSPDQEASVPPPEFDAALLYGDDAFNGIWINGGAEQFFGASLFQEGTSTILSTDAHTPEEGKALLLAIDLAAIQASLKEWNSPPGHLLTANTLLSVFPYLL